MTDSSLPTINYGGPAPRWVTVRKFFSEFEANLAANELGAAGVTWRLFNEDVKSVLSWYGGVIMIRLAVPSDQEEHARQILASHAAAEASDLEPAEPEDPDQPLDLADEEGHRATWSTAAVFESARALHEAAMVLESAHLSVLLPRLVPRSDAPPGSGPRFVLRVQSDDVARAQSLLQHAAAESAEEELRCPRCGAYSVHEGHTGFFSWLFSRSRPDECECLKCHYKGTPMEFGKRDR